MRRPYLSALVVLGSVLLVSNGAIGSAKTSQGQSPEKSPTQQSVPILLAQAVSGGSINRRFRQRLRNNRRQFGVRGNNRIRIIRRGIANTGSRGIFRGRAAIAPTPNVTTTTSRPISTPTPNPIQRNFYVLLPNAELLKRENQKSQGITIIRGEKRYDARALEEQQNATGEGPVVSRPPQEFIYGPKIIIVSEELKRRTAAEAGETGPKVIKLNP